MKKLAIISALVMYLVLNLGISVKLHYCGDSISFIDFFPVAHKSCCKIPKASCCKDKVAYVNPETTQSSTQVVNFSFPDYAKYIYIQQDFSFLSALETAQANPLTADEHREVFYRKVPIYLYNKVIIV